MRKSYKSSTQVGAQQCCALKIICTSRLLQSAVLASQFIESRRETPSRKWRGVFYSEAVVGTRARYQFDQNHDIRNQHHDIHNQHHDIHNQNHDIHNQHHDIPYQDHDIPYQHHDIPYQHHDIPYEHHDIPYQHHDILYQHRNISV